jgi:raffinose/stachyose/melibiose transport system permease protein
MQTLKQQEHSFLCMLPALLMIMIFFVIPLCYLIFVSFFKWNGLSPMEFVGFDNYRYIFKNANFRKALRITLSWLISAMFLHIPFGLLLSLMLNRRPKGWKFLRVMYFIPNVISTTAVAFMWYFIYHADMGLLNVLLRAIGLDHLTTAWLGNTQTALPCNQVPFILYVGLTSIIFLTQLTTIPSELYEAAEIDGADGLRQDYYVSFPLLKPAIITNVMLNGAFCLRTFEYPFLMTSGGPSNSTTNLALYIYREMMSANRYGVSMAAGLITILMGVFLMIMVTRLQKERT